jgi:hypothetical protein
VLDPAEGSLPQRRRWRAALACSRRVLSISAGQQGQRSWGDSLSVHRNGSFIWVPTGECYKNGEPKMKKQRVKQNEKVLDGAPASEEERNAAQSELARVSGVCGRGCEPGPCGGMQQSAKSRRRRRSRWKTRWAGFRAKTLYCRAATSPPPCAL